MQKSGNKKRGFGIVVLYGFETKNFFRSGLYEELSKNHKTAVLRRDFPSVNFSEYVERYELNVIKLEQTKPILKRLRSENIYLASRRARQRLKNIQNFNYFKSDRSLKATDYILGNWFVYKTIGAYAMGKIPKHYTSKSLESTYEKSGITDLIIAGYSSAESISLANTARQNERNVWLVINSWKDFYVNDLIPFNPTKIFVWSQQMKDQLLASNKHISASNVIISGNPSFDRFFSYKAFHTKTYYAKKYCFDVNRPLILYSMISPKAYAHEKESLELINKQLAKHYPVDNHRPVILLRKNPIDETPMDETYFSGNNVKYADNYFEGSYENAVFVQLNEGESEWMDLLFHADINMNVASTVTLEALMMKTPVINIEFNGKGIYDKGLGRYSKAPFYSSLYNRPDVVIAKTLDICINAIDNFLSNGKVIEDVTPILDKLDGQATQRIRDIILEG